MTLELKTETGREIWNQWGPGLRLVPAASVILPLAAGGCPPKELGPVHGSKDRLHCRWGPGVETEAVGSPRGIAASEEEQGGSGGVGCRVRLEWFGWEEGPGLEIGSLLRLGRALGAPKGAKWAFEEDCPGFR